MFARTALRTAARCARYQVPRQAVAVRWMSSGENDAKPPPVTNQATTLEAKKEPSAPLSTSQPVTPDATQAATVVMQASGSVPAGSENEVPDDVADAEVERLSEMQWEEDMEEGQEAADAEGEAEGEEGLESLTEAELDALIGPEDEVVSLEGLTEEQLAATPITGRSLVAPLFHPRTHGIPVATLQLRSYHTDLLALFTDVSAHAAAALAIPLSRPAPLPTRRNMWTVLRGPFVHKKSQENFERRTYKRVIKAWDADGEVVARWVRYLEKNLVPGVGMRVVRWERAPVGVGRKVLGAVREAVDPEATSREKIRALSEKIVAQELAAAAAHPGIEHPAAMKTAKAGESAKKAQPAKDAKGASASKASPSSSAKKAQ
ncbi:hypothetical protein EIP86_006441 [Pleurotus ostreatoroseus]|nr:hypothetical protein EIP86_006441 [Pleurotus ostreatoroseus]